MGEMVTLLSVSCVMMISMVSPLKLVFCVITTSVVVSILSYWSSLSVFAPSALTISFSSGMMIIFCYCAMFTSFESKKSQMALILVIPSTWALSACMKNVTTGESSLQLTKFLQTPTIWFAMAVVLVAMLGINKSLFSPSKPLSTSY